MKYRKKLEAFLPKLKCSDDDSYEILKAYDELSTCMAAKDILLSVIEGYEAKGELNYQVLIDELLPKIAELTGMHQYRVNMAVLFPLLPFTEPHYKRAGVSEKVWLDSIFDFVCKVCDCREIVGFAGLRSSSLNWFRAWFFAERFAFHRLQFEFTYAKENFESGDFTIKEGDPVIGIHIPSRLSGIPFDDENRLKSYQEAKAYFLPSFGNKPFAFRCVTWLLAPYNKEILPENSNTRRFTEEFLLGESYSGRWAFPLIFKTENIPDDKDLPENTGIQRAYKKLFLSGVEPCSTLGYKPF